MQQNLFILFHVLPIGSKARDAMLIVDHLAGIARDALSSSRLAR
jgi:hypothetical protein